MTEYREIIKLEEKLKKAKIPFEFRKIFDGYQICYPEKNTEDKKGVMKCSVIEHYGSYGHSVDLLEIMGLLTEEESRDDDVVGYLSADEVFQRIKKHYEEHIKEERIDSNKQVE